MSLKTIPDEKKANFSVVAQKSASSGAVGRNKLRRQGYYVLQKNRAILSAGHLSVFFIKKRYPLPRLNRRCWPFFAALASQHESISNFSLYVSIKRFFHRKPAFCFACLAETKSVRVLPQLFRVRHHLNRKTRRIKGGVVFFRPPPALSSVARAQNRFN